MPRALRPCPTCSEPVRGRCPDCRRTSDRQRGSGTARGWTTRWAAFSKQYLRDHLRCECTDPGCHPHGCDQPSTQPNHLGDTSRTTPDALNPDKVQALCHSCHSHYTGLHQPGGFRLPHPQ